MQRDRRPWRLAAAVSVTAFAAVVIVAVVGNGYRMTTHEVAVEIPGASLEAVVSWPEDGEADGLVLMVHGDGPVDATNDGYYLPWFEAAAQADFATVSWSKPGVGASTGNWLDQTMADRAAEVSAVLDWALAQPGLGADTVVLWAASQGGWVAPAVAASRADVDGVVAVGPAINWLRQGRYNLLAELEHAGASETERALAIAVSDQTRELLAAGESYPMYLAVSNDPSPMSAERWGFALRNYTSDATADLHAMAGRDVPVLLVLGRRDRNVDIVETAATYADILGDSVKVSFPEAMHSSARPIMEDEELVGAVTAFVWPRALFADGVLTGYEEFLARVV